jgi:hypothetical protein
MAEKIMLNGLAFCTDGHPVAGLEMCRDAWGALLDVLAFVSTTPIDGGDDEDRQYIADIVSNAYNMGELIEASIGAQIGDIPQ